MVFMISPSAIAADAQAANGLEMKMGVRADGPTRKAMGRLGKRWADSEGAARHCVTNDGTGPLGMGSARK